MDHSRRSGRPIQNGFLRALPAGVFAVLEPHLEPAQLNNRQILYATGDHAGWLYFIEDGLVSMVKPLADGRAVEVVAVGPEGVVCLSGMLGAEETLLDSIVHIPGRALKMKSAVFHAVAEEQPELKALAIQYAAYCLDQMAQTAACNTVHPLEKRLCRWLLAAHDSTKGDSMPLTHESLALMLGVQRPGVSLAMGALQRAGLVEKKKGWVTITDRRGVEAAACECHAATRSRFQDLLGQPA